MAGTPVGSTPMFGEWDGDENGLLYLLEMLHPDWHRDAACRGLDTDIFFPERGELITQATSVCKGCPVRVECEAQARDQKEDQGIWGGLSAHERRLRKKHRRLELANG